MGTRSLALRGKSSVPAPALPIPEPTAFVLIGYVGVLLIVEETVHLANGATIHVPLYAKFAGNLFIIWIALLYAADGAVRRAVRPLVYVAMPVDAREARRDVSIRLF